MLMSFSRILLLYLHVSLHLISAFRSHKVIHSPFPSSYFRHRQKTLQINRKPEPIFTSPIRVRFAPSPTGNLHVGGARTAMFNWLFARKNNGTFIVRVEDTDLARSTKESEAAILRDLQWMGIDWDEGPGIGGDYGPYRQSERKSIYQEYAHRLVESGHAYHCFSTVEERARSKQALENGSTTGEAPLFDNKWRNADKAEVCDTTRHFSRYILDLYVCMCLRIYQVEKRLANGDPHTIRFRVPDKVMFMDDFIRGRIRWDANRVLGDFVILRSNGMPVYNFCVAIDDVLMKVSHVIRGDEHLSNTLRQLLVMEALGARPPIYSHCSLILAPDKSKLSKRNGAASVDDFRRRGYLPQAMRNYLLLLGWNPLNRTTYMSAPQMIDNFLLSGLSKAPSVFKLNKLAKFQWYHVRALGFENITERVLEVANSSHPSLFRDFKSLSGEDVALMRRYCEPLLNATQRPSMSPEEMFNKCKKQFAAVLTSICLQNATHKSPLLITNESLWRACAEAAMYPLEETIQTDEGKGNIKCLSAGDVFIGL